MSDAPLYLHQLAGLVVGRMGLLATPRTYMQSVGSCFRKVDIRLSGKGNSNSHGAGPVY